ncbi:hypothetical protein ABFP37_17185 [Burkholderia sp. RS01]|uniref:hypothetical protein n=1 Tax=unclassified Burkholderia TaxID=2613784 RepID=UPI003218AD8E
MQISVRFLADWMPFTASGFPGRDFVSLNAGRRRRRRTFVGDEEEAALAVADGVVLALKPGRMVNAGLRLIVMSRHGVLEWIPDHGDRDLSTLPSLRLQ